MILLTLIYVIIMGCINLGKDNKDKKLPAEYTGDGYWAKPLVGSQWTGGFGFAVYSYEGIGIIFPV